MISARSCSQRSAVENGGVSGFGEPQPLHSLRLNPSFSTVATGIAIWRRTEGLAVARLKNRSEAVFARHRFYDFHAPVAGIDLLAGSNHSRSL